jgi:hypothetical protein
MTFAPRSPRAQRALLVVLATVLAAIALGAAIRGSAMAGLFSGLGPVHRLTPWVAALGAPWLIVAWGLGAVARRPWLGALAGALALSGGTVAWYLLTVAHHHNRSVHALAVVASAWIALGLASGALIGAAGALWRDPRWRAWGAAVPAGCLVGEAVLLSREWAGLAPAFVLRVELAAGFALALLLVRRDQRLVALGLTLAVAALAFFGEDAAREFARGFGWHGR